MVAQSVVGATGGTLVRAIEVNHTKFLAHSLAKTLGLVPLWPLLPTLEAGRSHGEGATHCGSRSGKGRGDPGAWAVRH